MLIEIKILFDKSGIFSNQRTIELSPKSEKCTINSEKFSEQCWKYASVISLNKYIYIFDSWFHIYIPFLCFRPAHATLSFL